jgi:hypothetical protein
VFAVGSAEAEDSVRNLVHEWNTMMVTSMPRYRVQASDYCPKCRIPLDEVIGQPRLMCRMCGHSARIVLLTTSSLPFSSCGSGSSSVDAVDPAYARDQHFMECMNRFLARFPHAIHPDQAKSLMKDLYRQGYRQAKDIDFTTVHLTMRKLQLAGLYKHENAVVSKIVGLPAPSLTPSDVAWLRYMFRMAQAPFMSMFSNTETSRKNFLIFPYFLHKAFVLLGQWHLLDRVPLPRCVTKLRRLESIWRFICAYNGWRFVPSPAVRKRAAHANGATGNKRARKMEEAILS